MSKLFESIMEIAEQKRIELNGRVLTLDYVYCAMTMIVENPDLLAGKDIDEGEMKAFKETLLQTSLQISSREIEDRIRDRQHTEEDVSEARNFIRLAGFKR